MAEAPAKLNRQKLTRGKLILVAVLAVVLVVVVCIQFGRSGGTTSLPSDGYQRTRAAVASRSARVIAKSNATPTTEAVNTGVALAPVIDATRWKSPVLESVVAYDPFALPSAFPQPKVVDGHKASSTRDLIAAAAADDAKRQVESLEKLQTQLEELQQRGVQMIIFDHGQYAATIGDRTLHAGDEINGFTVTAINPDGVCIERKKSP
ncbi:MAG TPA: hypothetical protein VFW73_05585 [Lacipirellulaceae bacterium]|nr:hypothetical protein [Lacipirellulaceae bacterium]